MTLLSAHDELTWKCPWNRGRTLIIALVAGFFGFFGIAGLAGGIAKILFVIFIILFIASLIFGRRRRL